MAEGERSIRSVEELLAYAGLSQDADALLKEAGLQFKPTEIASMSEQSPDVVRLKLARDFFYNHPGLRDFVDRPDPGTKSSDYTIPKLTMEVAQLFARAIPVFRAYPDAVHYEIQYFSPEIENAASRQEILDSGFKVESDNPKPEQQILLDALYGSNADCLHDWDEEEPLASPREP